MQRHAWQHEASVRRLAGVSTASTCYVTEVLQGSSRVQAAHSQRLSFTTAIKCKQAAQTATRHARAWSLGRADGSSQGTQTQSAPQRRRPRLLRPPWLPRRPRLGVRPLAAEAGLGRRGTAQSGSSSSRAAASSASSSSELPRRRLRPAAARRCRPAVPGAAGCALCSCASTASRSLAGRRRCRCCGSSASVAPSSSCWCCCCRCAAPAASGPASAPAPALLPIAGHAVCVSGRAGWATRVPSRPQPGSQHRHAPAGARGAQEQQADCCHRLRPCRPAGRQSSMQLCKASSRRLRPGMHAA